MKTRKDKNKQISGTPSDFKPDGAIEAQKDSTYVEPNGSVLSDFSDQKFDETENMYTFDVNCLDKPDTEKTPIEHLASFAAENVQGFQSQFLATWLAQRIEDEQVYSDCIDLIIKHHKDRAFRARFEFLKKGGLARIRMRLATQQKDMEKALTAERFLDMTMKEVNQGMNDTSIEVKELE